MNIHVQNSVDQLNPDQPKDQDIVVYKNGDLATYTTDNQYKKFATQEYVDTSLNYKLSKNGDTGTGKYTFNAPTIGTPSIVSNGVTILGSSNTGAIEGRTYIGCNTTSDPNINNSTLVVTQSNDTAAPHKIFASNMEITNVLSTWNTTGGGVVVNQGGEYGTLGVLDPNNNFVSASYARQSIGSGIRLFLGNIPYGEYGTIGSTTNDVRYRYRYYVILAHNSQHTVALSCPVRMNSNGIHNLRSIGQHSNPGINATFIYVISCYLKLNSDNTSVILTNEGTSLITIKNNVSPVMVLNDLIITELWGIV